MRVGDEVNASGVALIPMIKVVYPNERIKKMMYVQVNKESPPNHRRNEVESSLITSLETQSLTVHAPMNDREISQDSQSQLQTP